MKNIIILGQPRTGKTTLSNMIVEKFGYQVIHMDHVRNAFREVYPELGITPKTANENEKFQLFLKTYFDMCLRNKEKNNYNYVMEGCEINVADCYKMYSSENNIIIALGKTEVTGEELFRDIRKYDTTAEWTYRRTDEQLLEYAESIVEKSKEIKRECEKFNITFFDTSKNRDEVLNEIIDKIFTL